MGNELPREELDKILAWINEKWTTPKQCPMCSHNNWTVPEHLVTPPVYANNSQHLGGMSYPQFMVVCTNCGHTHYFNAAIAKLNISKKSDGDDDAA